MLREHPDLAPGRRPHIEDRPPARTVTAPARRRATSPRGRTPSVPGAIPLVQDCGHHGGGAGRSHDDRPEPFQAPAVPAVEELEVVGPSDRAILRARRAISSAG